MPGQTTLDFAVGVSVFRIVVAFVLAFVPTMLQPFDGSSQGETALTDRLAE
jgi:quinol-cytochrome oxidoreductase complex cytochrome b subunit